MRIAVIGTGGVGGYFGGRLALAGESVLFIARGAHLEALRRQGLMVESINGTFSLNQVDATDDPTGEDPVEAVLVAVKAWQVPQAAEMIRPLVGPHTFVVPLSNGVEAAGQLAAVLGAEHVLGGLCRISSHIAEPGLIRHTAIEPFVAFGELDGERSERVEKLRAAFQRAGFAVEVPADILKAVWEKFLFIAPLSGVGAVTRSPAGVFRAIPESRRLLEGAMQEVEAVARAQGIHLDDDIVPSTLAFVDKLPPHTVASMQRDIQEGRPSELEAQNGAVVRLGAESGVSTPVNGFLYASLLPAERTARGS
jgi:2-dehydropantoate 2-reductase